MMNAVVFNGVGKRLTFESVAIPQPGPGQVLIRVSRCGICGSDLHMTEDPVFCIPDGAILGHEFTGEVIETGKDVRRLKTGDKVSVIPIASCGHCAACLSGTPAACEEMLLHGGGFAEYTAVHERQCIRLPSTVGLDEGALVEPLAVGLHGVLKASMKPGDRVLVIGAGPVGLAVIFWARRLGAGLIGATAKSKTRAKLAQDMGADIFLDPEDFSPDTTSRAFGSAPDIVFECVGKPGLIQQSIDHVRPRGTVVVLGLCTGSDTIMPFSAISKEIRLQMAVFYDVDDFTRSVDALDRGATAPSRMITDKVGLSEMPDMFEALKKRTSQCKVLVTP